MATRTEEMPVVKLHPLLLLVGEVEDRRTCIYEVLGVAKLDIFDDVPLFQVN
jgi:hypothetical protein